MNREVATLPSSFYRDPEHYGRELEAIWQQEWLFAGHRASWPEAGHYRVITVGDQEILLTRDREGDLRAFYNTCRHRGAQLCGQAEGRFAAGRVVCPYHGWAYGLDGTLLFTPRGHDSEDFDPGRFPLYPVVTAEWRGFVFFHLSPRPPTSLADALGAEAEPLAGWPLEDLVPAHRETHEIACNWKVFWENFLECYHCPGVHPDLCRLVPLYGAGVSYDAALPEGHALKGTNAPLREGAVTWSPNGQPVATPFRGLGPAERSAGMTFATVVPGVFMVAHLDYLRTVQVLPAGPERTRLTVEWYVSDEAPPNLDTAQLTALGRQVVMEDARVCELNQRGLRNRVHVEGVLMPPERDVADFHDWVRDRLARPRTNPA